MTEITRQTVSQTFGRQSNESEFRQKTLFSQKD